MLCLTMAMPNLLEEENPNMQQSIMQIISTRQRLDNLTKVLLQFLTMDQLQIFMDVWITLAMVCLVGCRWRISRLRVLKWGGLEDRECTYHVHCYHLFYLKYNYHNYVSPIVKFILDVNEWSSPIDLYKSFKDDFIIIYRSLVLALRVQQMKRIAILIFFWSCVLLLLISLEICYFMDRVCHINKYLL